MKIAVPGAVRVMDDVSAETFNFNQRGISRIANPACELSRRCLRA